MKLVCAYRKDAQFRVRVVLHSHFKGVFQNGISISEKSLRRQKLGKKARLYFLLTGVQCSTNIDPSDGDTV